MQLNIKNDEVRRDASELSRVTGETVTKAVGVAVRERLERVRKQRDFDAFYADIQELQRHVADAFKAAGNIIPTQREMDDEMYDEWGLPR